MNYQTSQQLAGRNAVCDTKRERAPELPAAIERCQKSTAELNEQVHALISQLASVTNPCPSEPAGDSCVKEEVRNGLLHPMHLLDCSIQNSARLIRQLRESLMV
jgi:hypothetical protein